MTTAAIEHCLDIPVSPGVSLYDVQVEVEVIHDLASDDFAITAISLDAFADVRKPGGKRWAYVEIARWHPGHNTPFTGTKLAWHLAAVLRKTLEKDSRFAEKAREALCLANEGERINALEQRTDMRREDRAAAE